MRSCVVALLLFSASTAAAQGRCTHREYDGDELVFETGYRLDRAGRVIAEDYLNDRAAFATSSRLRYGADGQLTEVLVEIHEGPTATGPQPPIRYSYAQRGTELVEFRESDRDEDDRVTRWRFDEQGYPAELQVAPSAEDPAGSRAQCAFDLLGRPIYRSYGTQDDARYETRWIWGRDGRLARIVRTTPVGDRTLQVVQRGRALTIRGEEGVEETWTGPCEGVMFLECSPALAPQPPNGERRVIRTGAAVRPARVAPTQRNRFAPLPVDRPLELSMLAGQYVGREVFTSVTFGENDPSYPIPVVCAGSSLGECATTVHYDTLDRRATWIVSTDRDLVGGAALRVGAQFTAVAGELRDCLVDRGLELAIHCEVAGHEGVTAWFDGLDADPTNHREGPPSPAMTRVATLIRLEWRAPTRAE